MKYMGSKNRFAKELLPIILKDRTPNQWYIEPMVGGANMIDKVDGNRLGSDFNEYLTEMWSALINGWKPKEHYTKEEYIDIKNNKENYPKHLVGYVGFICSYSGKWFGGYANNYPESRRLKNGTLPNYQKESLNSLNKQIPKLISVQFTHSSYHNLEIPKNSIIYCDPPYEGTTKYKDGFIHTEFWEWCRNKVKEGHKVFISEYKAPKDFKCIWSKEASSQLSANGKIGGNKISTEKLFTYCG
tara:strand:- start:1202 stop:1930 length:729 start_codon:yes stop_codon:yes gene_type:complete